MLAANAEWLKENKRARTEIEGHCDERGTVEYNLALGAKRAKAVKDYLVSLGRRVGSTDHDQLRRGAAALSRRERAVLRAQSARALRSAVGVSAATDGVRGCADAGASAMSMARASARILALRARGHDRRLRDAGRHPGAAARAAPHADAARRHARRLRFDAARRRQGARRRRRGALLVARRAAASPRGSTSSRRGSPRSKDIDPQPATSARRTPSADVTDGSPTPAPVADADAGAAAREIAATDLSREEARDVPDDYRRGLALVRQGAYDQAIQSLRDFLRTNRESPLAPNAQYWIGESYYMLGRLLSGDSQLQPSAPAAPQERSRARRGAEDRPRVPADGQQERGPARVPEGAQRLPVLAGGGSGPGEAATSARSEWKSSVTSPRARGDSSRRS